MLENAFAIHFVLNELGKIASSDNSTKERIHVMNL